MWVGLWRLLGGSLLCGAGYVLCCSLIFSWESGADAGTGSGLYDAGLIVAAARPDDRAVGTAFLELPLELPQEWLAPSSAPWPWW